MDDTAAADQVPSTPEDDQGPSDNLDEDAEAAQRARRLGTSCWQTAGNCCAEAACDSACGLLSASALFHLLRVAVTDVRHSSGLPGRSRSQRLALAAIRAYQRDISPRRPPCCRLTPTCSAYAAEAVTRHGAIRGTLRTAGRLRRCGARGRRRLPIAPDPVR